MTEFNQIYNMNLNSLEKRYPRCLEKLNSEDDSELDIYVVDSKDENKSMVIKNQGYTMHIHSKYRPLQEARRWADTFKITKYSVIIMFGFGLGYYAKEIVKQMDKDNILLIVEPNVKVFKEAIRHIDCSDILENKNVYLALGKEYKNILWQIVTLNNVSKVIYKSIPNYDKLFLKDYKNFVEAIKEIMYIRTAERNTVMLFSKKWQFNLFKNLPYIFESNFVKDLFNMFEKKPAIIVSAGPSLNKNVHLLKKVKEKAVIICVDTALKVLLKENIKPDLVISVDGDILNYEKFKGINYDDIPLVYTIKVYPDILKDHKGEKILFLLRDEEFIVRLFKELHVDPGYLSIGGSVATSAFSLAVQMGADPIIFIGQDLAYTGKKTHAEGTMYDGRNKLDDQKSKSNKIYMTVKDINGQDILTDAGLYTFLVWFEKQIAEDKSEKMYIDATEGGAKIKGTKVMTFAEVIDKYCLEDIDVTRKIKDIFDNKRVIKKEDIIKIIDNYKEIRKEFERIKNKCEKALDLSSKLYKIYKNNRYNTAETDKILEKLDKIDNYIKDRKSQFELINSVLQPVIYSVFNVLNSEEDESERQKGMRIAKKSELLYSGIKEAIDYSIPLLDECIKDMEKLTEKQ
ncbi:motility associated factor glycosyltransferase family protein [Caloranaerobacter ferrireducens]|uniref:motility associated factor glycosyltransferase family protein n=1 Tax=Caloranaerobacter ferrireducens TaxID=1323370 RepID=UPI00084D6E33|nr:6-hydroxymethylpterin diphosphokinase MptE-like protein [Caloranaerobacter ferrireducens]